MTPATILDVLDELIAAGWGDVPRRKIPENWRDIPREVRQHDLERVRLEQTSPSRIRVQAIEDANRRVNISLGEQVQANETQRRKVGGPKVPVSQAWLDLVATKRARRRVSA